MKTILFAVALAFSLAGCGIAQDVGVACMVNQDCDVGLSCIATDAVASGVCTATGKKVCTKQCVSDTECIKSAPICQTSCSGLKTCGTASK